MHWMGEALLSSLKEGALLNVINVPVVLAGMFLLGVAPLDIVGLLLLLEATGLMLGGGAMELGATASTRRLANMFQGRKNEWRGDEYRKTQKRAMVFTLTGVVLFAESMLLAALTV